VITGYPGSIASTWQQAGRSGRGEEKSLSFLIAQDNPLDQYFMNNPDSFFSKPFENALINLENNNILKPHLLCAAWEQPLNETMKAIRHRFSEALELENEGVIRKVKEVTVSPHCSSCPTRQYQVYLGQILLRYRRLPGYELLEQSNRAERFQVHPGAIYIHQGRPILSMNDLEKRCAGDSGMCLTIRG
jgi:DEAD/DEAH box helicase domain-containing protein